MSKHYYLAILLCTSLILLMQSSWAVQKRVALVIGNGSYKNVPLKNPKNDASDMAVKLKKLGFQVDKLINADLKHMTRSIQRFGKSLQQKNTVGLFYFAGHGVQMDGSNYLLPVDANIESEADIQFEAVNAARVLQQMERSENNLNLVILDACRNNPFSRSFRSASRGLAKMEAPRGSMILYATSPNNVAADGQGRNGLFTEKLLKIMSQKGLKIEEVFKKTAIAVNTASGQKQSPYIEGFILGDFYFNGNVTNQPSASQNTHSATDEVSLTENRFWDEVKADPGIEMYQAYLYEYPNGHYVRIANIKLKKLTHRAPATPPDKVNTGQLTIRSNVNNDRVALNGKNYGSSRLDLSLNAGNYQLVISKDGYKDYIKKLSISSGSQQTVYAKLSHKISQSSPNNSNQKSVELRQYGINMAFIVGGYFNMGSPDSEKGRRDDERLHRVYVNDFYINKTEVTLKAFQQFTQDTGYKTDAEKNTENDGCLSKSGKNWQWVKGRSYKAPGFKQANNHPVVCVSHNDVLAYIKWLNGKTGHVFRLPTEAEWEYAARGGKDTVRFWGNNSSLACQYANVADKNTRDRISWNNQHNCDDGFNMTTSPVGYFESNPYGLKDMLGNVWEWTCSNYNKSYNGSEQHCNSFANLVSVRGGSRFNPPDGIRSAIRAGDAVFRRVDGLGFRLVQEH